MSYPKLIDNRRVSLANTIKQIAPYYKHLSIATGYWDLKGTAEIVDEIENYDSIRLIIGNEPLSKKLQRDKKLGNMKEENMFPEYYFMQDLIEDASSLKTEIERAKLRETAIKITKMIEEGRLEVKVFKKTMLHAKAYIFGTYSDKSVGIVGSSNFTKAGLTLNTELNALQDNYMIVNYRPTADDQENGYLSWFDEIWNDPNAVEWNGEFKELIKDSPLGDLTFGNYDSYIRTLMEVYPDELIPPMKLEEKTNDILYSFQNRNAGILINKLEKTGVAILADSVGLGKTITAGAVIKHYLDKMEGKANVLIIAPAALKQQWKDDLASILGVDYLEGAYSIVSEQDTNAIQHIFEEYQKEWRTKKNIDLFVIDEAHNLRSKSGTRHDVILNLLQQHPNSHILLLTATPINNSLMDIINQIQLASKGKLTSVNVTYTRPSNGLREKMDFFEALSRIQSQIRSAEKAGESVESILEKAKPTIHEGLKHYLVRSTRQGVETEGGIVGKDGSKKSFPKSNVDSIEYQYDSSITDFTYDEIGKHIHDCFENIDPRSLNLNLMSEFTQMTLHPLELLNQMGEDEGQICDYFNVNEDVFMDHGSLYNSNTKSLIFNLLQIVFMLGFVPYRPDIYNRKFHGKTVQEIDALNDVSTAIKMQMTVHNILQITWLKRLESSPYALKKSVENYKYRVELFKKYLDKGYIVNLNDANLLESDYNYGEDIEQAFVDYEEYLKKKEEFLNSGKSIDDLKKEGIERKDADPKIFDIDSIYADINRDLKIINLLSTLLSHVASPKNDIKMHELAQKVCKVLKEKKYGKKVLVFSFFADTINSLRDNLPQIIKKEIPDFDQRAEFISGMNTDIEKIVRRFSPKSKKHTFASGEAELNFLFSTDVLSEGQNLQDSGFLVNYDLHWNPVRMIQRNGRINRLGSEYDAVLVLNMRPTDELEMYLNLVHRLETKINTIKNTVGLDQGILSSSDVNPIEFIEKYYDDGTLPEPDDDLLAYSDEHILELRKFLGKNKDTGEIERIQNMPLGKWNYLPHGRLTRKEAIAMIKTYRSTVTSNIKSTDIIFIKTTKKDGEYEAEHMDYTAALDLIRTTEDDNERHRDVISLDKTLIRRRSFNLAVWQLNNLEEFYKISPKNEEILCFLKNNFLQPGIDYLGILKNGIKTTNHKKALEKILRAINKEQRETGSLKATTLNQFIKLFNEISHLVDEEKQVDLVEGVLYYAGN